MFDDSDEDSHTLPVPPTMCFDYIIAIIIIMKNHKIKRPFTLTDKSLQPCVWIMFSNPAFGWIFRRLAFIFFSYAHSLPDLFYFLCTSFSPGGTIALVGEPRFVTHQGRFYLRNRQPPCSFFSALSWDGLLVAFHRPKNFVSIQRFVIDLFLPSSSCGRRR